MGKWLSKSRGFGIDAKPREQSRVGGPRLSEQRSAGFAHTNLCYLCVLTPKFTAKDAESFAEVAEGVINPASHQLSSDNSWWLAGFQRRSCGTGLASVIATSVRLSSRPSWG